MEAFDNGFRTGPYREVRPGPEPVIERYRGPGPYVDIDMNPVVSSADQGLSHKDAVIISPHKFVGGPGTPGVLIAKKSLFQNPVPSGCGGGSVFFVSRETHRYLQNVETREEGGTPAIVESIRAGLVFQLKEVQYRSRDKHHRDSGFCGISRGSLRDITRETAGYPAGVCGISRGRLRDIPRYSFGRPVVSRVPRSEKTWCETPKSTAARNGDGGVPNVYFYVLPGDLCWADGV
ncbi:hypothetical protein Bbelb_117720 [Branchiostoma belcheri]|nr:hypothetical protein Bbelb_117720 [Branchiostoma belcheri]